VTEDIPMIEKTGSKMVPARLFLFGHFRWELDGSSSSQAMRDKTQALLACIALSPDGRIKRNYAANLLWERGKDPKASLRQAIREIRSLEEESGTDLFDADARYLSLNLDKLWVDARIASEYASGVDLQKAEEVALSITGPLLEDCIIEEDMFHDWQRTECSRREADMNTIFDILFEHFLNKERDLDKVKNLALSALKLDSTNEAAHCTLMSVFAAQSDKAAAMRQFETCASALRDELGLEPSEKVMELAYAIRTQSEEETYSRHNPPALVETPEQMDEKHLKPVILLQPFVMSGIDQFLDYYLQSFRADLCEQLCQNCRFSVREASLQDVHGTLIGDSIHGTAGVSQYTVRGQVLSGKSELSLLIHLLDGKSDDILWMNRIKVQGHQLQGANLFDPKQTAMELLRFAELREMEKANNTEDSHLNPRQCVSRAKTIMFRFSSQAVLIAEQYLQRALDQSPLYGEALAWLAFLRSIEIGQGFTANAEATREEIRYLSQQALEISPHDDTVLAILGHLEAFVYHDFENAAELFKRSLSVNSNGAYGWGFSAITRCYTGKPEDALPLLERCRQIMPFDPHPHYFNTARCIASLLSGQYEDAVRLGRQVLRNNPAFHASYRPMISSLGHLGRQEEAEPIIAELTKHQPDFSINWHLDNYPPLEEAVSEQYVSGLRKAGVTE